MVASRRSGGPLGGERIVFVGLRSFHVKRAAQESVPADIVEDSESARSARKTSHAVRERNGGEE